MYLFSICNWIILRWMSQGHIDDKSALVMAWCRQTTNHCWQIPMTPYGVTRAQCVNPLHHESISVHWCSQHLECCAIMVKKNTRLQSKYIKTVTILMETISKNLLKYSVKCYVGLRAIYNGHLIHNIKLTMLIPMILKTSVKWTPFVQQFISIGCWRICC